MQWLCDWNALKMRGTIHSPPGNNGKRQDSCRIPLPKLPPSKLSPGIPHPPCTRFRGPRNIVCIKSQAPGQECVYLMRCVRVAQAVARQGMCVSVRALGGGGGGLLMPHIRMAQSKFEELLSKVGTDLDKLRLFLVYYFATEEVGPDEEKEFSKWERKLAHQGPPHPPRGRKGVQGGDDIGQAGRGRA